MRIQFLGVPSRQRLTCVRSRERLFASYGSGLGVPPVSASDRICQMRLMTFQAGSIALLSLLSLSTGVGLASPWVTATACDSVQLDGAYYPRVTFEIHNLDPGPENPICSFFVAPQSPGAPTDTCRAIQSAAPPAWATAIEPSNGHVLWVMYDTKNSSCIYPGQSLGGFSLTLSRAQNCCYDIYFEGVFPEPFAHDTVCYSCDRVVSARASTWGQLKSCYRE